MPTVSLNDRRFRTPGFFSVFLQFLCFAYDTTNKCLLIGLNHLLMRLNWAIVNQTGLQSSFFAAFGRLRKCAGHFFFVDTFVCVWQ